MLGLRSADETTAAETAFSLLRDRILTGDLPPGTKLNQASLARQLGMSRIPVRDAIRALAAEGLVSHDPHRTAVVTDLSPDGLAELYELRLALEPRASELAVAHLQPEDIDEMQECLAYMEDDSLDPAWLEIHDRFHASLYRRSRRPRMIEILERARAQTRRYTWLRLDRDANDIAAEHRLILAAARRRDSAAVQAMVEAHLTASYGALRERLRSADSRDRGGKRLQRRGGVQPATA